MARLLVAGGSGLIGSALVRQALAQGHELTLLSRRKLDVAARVVEADLCDPLSLGARLSDERFDAVVYLAQAAEHNEFPAAAAPAVALNIGAPVALCQWAVQQGCQRFIYASSGGICGPAADRSAPIMDSAARQPTEALTFYLATKARCEELLGAFGSLIQLQVLRYFFVYGPGQKANFLFPRLARKIVEGSSIELAAGVGPWMNPVHAEDAATLTLNSLHAKDSSTINIAGLEVVSLADIVDGMEQALGRKAVIQATQHASPVYVASTDLMRERLGSPRIRLSEGLPGAIAVHGGTTR